MFCGGRLWPRLQNVMGIMPHLRSPNRLSCYLNRLLDRFAFCGFGC